MKMKQLVTLTAVALGLMVISSDAFALGRSKHHGYRGWTNGSTSNGGSTSADEATDPVGDNDSNPVPEPTSMLMLGSALAGFGGYRGLKARFAKK